MALVRVYLAIPSTSVSSERMFSKAGVIISECRSRLAPEKVEQIAFFCLRTGWTETKNWLWFRNRDPTFAASTISRGESGTTRPRCHIRVRVRLGLEFI